MLLYSDGNIVERLYQLVSKIPIGIDTATSTTSDNDSLPSWAVGLISFFCIAFVLATVAAICLYQRGNRYKNMVPEESLGVQPTIIQGKMMNVGSSHEKVPANEV